MNKRDLHAAITRGASRKYDGTAEKVGIPQNDFNYVTDLVLRQVLHVLFKAESSYDEEFNKFYQGCDALAHDMEEFLKKDRETVLEVGW